jgi:uncharacterized protein YbjT (DUF2867 family)
MDSVDTVVLITPFDPTAADQAHAAITAAQAANVRRIVRLSVILADPDGPTDSYRLHGRTDAEIQASNLTYTIVRPSTFMQNFGDLAATILSDPAIRIPFGDGRLGYIDARDVVDVFEQVIVSDTHDGQVLSLTGPASISLTEAARVFSQVLGREITHIPVPPAETENYFRAMGLDGWALTVLCDYCDAFRRNYQDIVTDGVERVTGHAARSLDNFIREEFVPMLQHNGSTTQEATPHLD